MDQELKSYLDTKFTEVPGEIEHVRGEIERTETKLLTEFGSGGEHPICARVEWSRVTPQRSSGSQPWRSASLLWSAKPSAVSNKE